MKIEEKDKFTPNLEEDAAILNHSTSVLNQNFKKVSRIKMLKELRNGAKTVFKRSWINELPLLLIFILSLISSFFGTIYYPKTVKVISINIWLFGEITLSIALLVLVSLVPLSILIHKLLDSRYIITNENIISINGLMSLKVNTSRMHLSHVRGLEVERSLLQRFLNTGDLLIGSASHDAQEVIMTGVYNPTYYQGIIEQLMKDYVKE